MTFYEFIKLQRNLKKSPAGNKTSAPETHDSQGVGKKSDTPLFLHQSLRYPMGTASSHRSSQTERAASISNTTALAEIWHAGNKGPFFQKLRMLGICDPAIKRFIEENLYGDDYWLATNLLKHGPEPQWPIHLKVEREMKGWADSGGKGRVFKILRNAPARERQDNIDLFLTLASYFDMYSDDFWLAYNLMDEGPEGTWPLNLQVERMVKGWPGVDGSVENILNFIYSEVTDDQTAVFEFLQQLRLDYMAQGKPKSQVATIEKVLHAYYAQIAQFQDPGVKAPKGGWPVADAPGSLLAGTHPLSAAERQNARLSLTPTGKAIGDFIPEIPGKGTYEARVRKALTEEIDRLYKLYVEGKGLAEHKSQVKGIRVNLYPHGIITNIGNLAKNATDAIFQSYRVGKKMVWDRTITDRFQSEHEHQQGLTPKKKRENARALVYYLINQSAEIYQVINKEHNARPSRNAEASILRRIVNELTNKPKKVERLNHIERGYPAGTIPVVFIIEIQRFKAGTDTGNQKLLWEKFQYLIHEYTHTLAHPYYSDYAESFGKESLTYDTLIEGVSSLLTEIVWSNINFAELRKKIEGQDLAELPFDQSQVPITAKRYPSYMAAMRLANTVGIQNLFAAYFLGRVDLIGR